jgi:hypothetical protein
VRAPAEYAGFYGRIVDLDKQIETEYAEGYDVDVHLEDRAELQREWEAWTKSTPPKT